MVKQQNAEKPTTNSNDDGRNDCRFKGVRKRKWGKYVSEIRLPNSRERIWLGSYDTAEKAARAFDAALFCLRGRSAKFNFPDNPPDIAGARSLSRAEIQTAAARFANSDFPGSLPGRPARPGSAESPSPSPSVVSDGSLTAPLDGELANDASFMELFENLGSGHGYDGSGWEPGMFTDYGDLEADFFPPSFPVANEYVVEDYYAESSDLWSF